MSDNTIADLQATVSNAVEEYARANGDGFYQPDWLGAREYEDAGIAIGEEAFKLPEDEHDAYIEDAAEQHPASARYLVSWAATLRLAECERAASKDHEPIRSMLINAMFDIAKAGAPKPHITGEK